MNNEQIKALALAIAEKFPFSNVENIIHEGDTGMESSGGQEFEPNHLDEQYMAALAAGNHLDFDLLPAH